MTTHNYVVGLSQFGNAADNTIVSFDQAASLIDVCTDVASLSAIVPDPHAVTGPSFAAEINARLEALSLDFLPLPSAEMFIDSGTPERAPPTDHLQRIRSRGAGVDIGPNEFLPTSQCNLILERS